jgi:hypothetical protein
MRRPFSALLSLLLAPLLAACVPTTLSHDELPAMRWDHVPASAEWEAASFAALGDYAAILPTLVPEDIDAWCPGYPDASQVEREAFWVGLMSALAQHESTWRPHLVGGNGRWFGLVQISPATARHYGCAARSGEALLDGVANVRCAYRIWARTVARDNMVSRGNRGVAADWGPMHSSQSHKRDDMRAWISAQPYCAG